MSILNMLSWIDQIPVSPGVILSKWLSIFIPKMQKKNVAFPCLYTRQHFEFDLVLLLLKHIMADCSPSKAGWKGFSKRAKDTAVPNGEGINILAKNGVLEVGVGPFPLVKKPGNPVYLTTLIWLKNRSRQIIVTIHRSFTIHIENVQLATKCRFASLPIVNKIVYYSPPANHLYSVKLFPIAANLMYITLHSN